MYALGRGYRGFWTIGVRAHGGGAVARPQRSHRNHIGRRVNTEVGVPRVGFAYPVPMANERVPGSGREGSAVILFDAAGRVLLQQRDDDIGPAGYGRWTVPGGGREGDEDPRTTALREMEEETGLRLQRLRFFAEYTPETLPGLYPGRVHVFFADDEVDEATIQVNEGLDFRFWTPEETLSLPMNPPIREQLRRFFASDKYLGALAIRAPYKVGAAVIEIDRWGRVLLQLRDADLPLERYPDAWALPGGMLLPAESPDAAALREFEEETGHLLEAIKLFRVYRKEETPTALVDVQHVYYIDADLDLDTLEVNEGQGFGYFAPAELAGIAMPPHTRTIVEEFVASAAYKAMFH